MTQRTAQTWLSRAERGTTLGIRFVFWLATLAGRWTTHQLARLLALYYAVFDVTTKRTSREYLERVHGRRVRWREVYQHVLRFAHVSIDRIFLLKGKLRYFDVTRTGTHHLAELTEAKRGAVLIGAHLGSFEAMRAGGSAKRYPINIVGHFENARMINALLEQIDPHTAARVIHAGDNPVSFATKVKKVLDAGELVAILGDRVGLNDKTTTVTFFGEPAEFPSGPFILASVLRCPVYLVFGLYFEPNRYHLYCEPFAERIELPRATRQEALTATIQRYAERLEEFCRKAPDNWFNFYDFWRTS
ncbi:MAG: hypothetical protein KC503_36750 [Myxococcales bacterium]|nr:hypothetical protein [Myxococcales bacterium]